MTCIRSLPYSIILLQLGFCIIYHAGDATIIEKIEVTKQSLERSIDGIVQDDVAIKDRRRLSSSELTNARSRSALYALAFGDQNRMRLLGSETLGTNEEMKIGHLRRMEVSHKERYPTIPGVVIDSEPSMMITEKNTLAQTLTIPVDENSAEKQKPTAILHIGPHKTATTTIQTFMKNYQTEMYNDGYEFPGDWTDPLTTSINMERLVNCFQFPEFRTPNDCDTQQYDDIAKIAERGSNMILTAETFAYHFTDVSKVREAVSPWGDNVVVVAYYRRFFEWLISYYNMEMRYKPVPERLPLADWLEDEARMEHNYMELFTYGLVSHWDKYFPDKVKVYNMHDKEHIKAETFFCDAIPRADKTCQVIKANNEVRQANPSTDSLVYGEIAYAAYQMKLFRPDVSDPATIDWDDIVEKVKSYQEDTLGLKSTNFDPLRCPSSTVIERIKEKSLQAEMKLAPEFYTTAAGEATLLKKFERNLTKYKFCSVDAKRLLEEDSRWQTFFQTSQ
jgi:hypothetical protein